MKEFIQYNFQVKSPIIIVADIEATNSPNTTITLTASTEIKRIHRINSYAFFIHIDDDLDNIPYEEFRERLHLHQVADNSKEAERELIAKFMRDVYSIAERLSSRQNSMDQESQLINLKNEHILEYATDKTCIHCGEDTVDSKVFDSDHCKNKYNGPAHSSCNMREHKQKKKEMFGEERHWKLSMVGQNIKFVCGDIISIKDGYALLPMPLSDLGRQLGESECVYQREYGKRINGKWGKGIYPYEWVSDVCRMDEREFPPMEAFENSLGNKVFDDDYAKAGEFFNLNCTTFRDYHDYYLRQDVLILTKE